MFFPKPRRLGLRLFNDFGFTEEHVVAGDWSDELPRLVTVPAGEIGVLNVPRCGASTLYVVGQAGAEA